MRRRERAMTEEGGGGAKESAGVLWEWLGLMALFSLGKTPVTNVAFVLLQTGSLSPCPPAMLSTCLSACSFGANLFI